MKVQRVPFLRVQTCSFGKDCICKGLVALVHRPKESFFLIPQEEPKSVECLQPASRCCKEFDF
ncbi:hypothetical protein RchiOBHm_Chr2g0116331 [Rosa chinensis]|uniref:Uncharacterized protein n=1 Tax=Rosa chinensis TaxID=74649 RepID=A0A2P6RR76_ROSCH|nr:hypothetical protein RchiOBHm_Chr2g0116331 [Rosa chinensis]